MINPVALLGVSGGPALFAITAVGGVVDLRGAAPLVVRGSRALRWVPSYDGAWSACEALSGGARLAQVAGAVVPPA